MGIEPWLLRAKAPIARVKLMLMGEALDLNHRLLSHMLKSIGLSFDDVCILPVEPFNTPAECKHQILEISPQVLFAMGPMATQCLLNAAEVTHQRYDYHGIPLFVSDHPDYLLRNPLKKKNAYRDLLAAQKLLTTC